MERGVVGEGDVVERVSGPQVGGGDGEGNLKTSLILAVDLQHTAAWLYIVIDQQCTSRGCVLWACMVGMYGGRGGGRAVICVHICIIMHDALT